MNTDTSIRPWRGFIITPDDRVEILFEDETYYRDVAPGLFERLLLAGYPAGQAMLESPPDDPPFIDVSIDPTEPAPEVTAYLTHRDPAQRRHKMGEASTVFLDWYRQWDRA